MADGDCGQFRLYAAECLYREGYASIVNAFTAVVEIGISRTLLGNPSTEFPAPLIVRKILCCAFGWFFKRLLHDMHYESRQVCSGGCGAAFQFRLLFGQQSQCDVHSRNSPSKVQSACITMPFRIPHANGPSNTISAEVRLRCTITAFRSATSASPRFGTG